MPNLYIYIYIYIYIYNWKEQSSFQLLLFSYSKSICISPTFSYFSHEITCWVKFIFALRNSWLSILQISLKKKVFLANSRITSPKGCVSEKIFYTIYFLLTIDQSGNLSFELKLSRCLTTCKNIRQENGYC